MPWSTFSSEISSATLSHGKGRLTAEATLSGNGADEKWQLTLYSYDADGRIVKKYIYTESASSVALAIDVTLDRQGMPTWQHTTVGSNNFYHWWDYDARGNLDKTYVATTNSKPGTADVDYNYNAAGLVSNIKYGGSYNSVPYAYNSRDWLRQIGNTATTTYPFSAFYIYQNNGTIEETDYYNKQSPATYKQYKYDHTYDSMNRLLGADYSYENSGWQTSAAYDLTDISYDPNGNLLAMKRYRSAGTLIDDLTYEYTSGTNKLDYTDDAVSTTGETWDAEDGSTGDYAYDANGSMTALPAPYNITSAVYDVRGLVTKVVTGAGTTTYRYNSAGERYWRAGSDYYALDGAVQLGVFTTGGTLQYWNIIAGGRVVGRYESGNRKYYHTDHLGTTRAVVEGDCSSGCTIREARDYDAWGVEMAGRTYLSGNAAKEGYTGKERDSETGLDYFGARFYLQAIGRWNAVDPKAEKYAGWSPFNYVINNPVQHFDPNGQEPCCVATLQLSGRVQPWGSFEGVLGLAVDTNGEWGLFVSGSIGVGFGLGFAGEVTGSVYPGLDSIHELEQNPGFSIGAFMSAGEGGGTGELNLSGASFGVSGGYAVGLGIGVYAQRTWTKFLYSSNGSISLEEYLQTAEGQGIRSQLGLTEEEFNAVFKELGVSLRNSTKEDSEDNDEQDENRNQSHEDK